jgi:dihydroxyacetone kinase-like protein
MLNQNSNSFSNADGAIIVRDIALAIQKNKDLLSELDGIIGDGDHGINMNKGFTMSLELLQIPGINFSKALMIVANTLMNEIGGSMGPLYGTFFKKMARVSKDEEEITAQVFQKMLSEAIMGVMDMGNAKPGDKTLVDTLTIAQMRYNAAIENDKTFELALAECAAGAKEGKESTRDMMARVGRSARLGERSIGHVDAGASSCAIIVKTMCFSMINLLNN